VHLHEGAQLLKSASGEPEILLLNQPYPVAVPNRIERLADCSADFNLVTTTNQNHLGRGLGGNDSLNSNALDQQGVGLETLGNFVGSASRQAGKV
jgi:hypothetical protein